MFYLRYYLIKDSGRARLHNARRNDMKNRILYLLLLITFYSCSQNNDQNSEPNKIKQSKINNQNPTTEDSINLPIEDKIGLFSYAKSFPIISDTSKFISELRNAFNIESWYREQQPNEKINAYKKIKIFGAQKELILIEYDFIEGASASFPYKYQIIMTIEGKLIAVLDGLRYEFLKVFENQSPFLLVLTSTSKGNGSHQLYKFSNDTLENVIDKVGYFPRTYDNHSDHHINVPNELKLKIRDKNSDGFNDLIFSGKMKLNSLGNSVADDAVNNKTIPLELIFIYDEKTGHFKELEDYSKKYKEH